MRKKALHRIKPKTKKFALLTPLEYIVQEISDPKTPTFRRDELAKVALPYMHTKLPVIRRTSADGLRKAKEKKDHPPMGKKEALVNNAKTAHKKSEWGNDLQ